MTETALAHVIGDKAEQAYRRSDALEKRRKLMEAWASYCEPSATGNIVAARWRRIGRLPFLAPHCHYRQARAISLPGPSATITDGIASWLTVLCRLLTAALQTPM